MSNIISRADALAQGLVHFYTGKPCKAGHIVRRFTANGGCVDCVNPKRRGVASGSKLLPCRIAIPESVTIEPHHVEELHALLTGWAMFKLREWGYATFDQSTKVNWGPMAEGTLVTGEDGVVRVRQADGSLKERA